MRFTDLQEQAQAVWSEFCAADRHRLLVGTGTCGQAAGIGAVREAFLAAGRDLGLDLEVTEVGCLGLCYAEPLVELSRPGGPRVLYGNVSPDQVPRLARAYYGGEDLCADLALAVMSGGDTDGIPAFPRHPMMSRQQRIVLRNCGVIDPGNLHHYVARGGYAGLAKALGMTPEDVIAEVKKSGLRGRGGAGFPTGVKWELCRRAAGHPKYMVCNADEGDPGAFMDRAVVESDPHSVLEGMAIAAHAIGAEHGYVYVRAEYPLAIERLESAIRQAEANGLLGENILGTGFRFRVTLKKGAGAFVCGEETALMASIEGNRGMPRPRPPFPAQRGLFGKPTNINNVETLANLPEILSRGGDWFARFGTEKSRGTKTFALAGKVVRTGLIEVPLGITLQEIVFDVGGGIPGDKRIRAVQTGGPSGGCIPARLLSLPVDYESLAAVGAIMGSGGMVVMDEDTCLVDIARYFVEFTHHESCGKCAPCRLGTRQMLLVLNAITRGEGKPGDVDLLEAVAESVKLGSLCGLGQTAPNPVLTTLRYFRSEYEDHITHRKCPAVVCGTLVGAPCRHTCPAGIDVPRYVRYVAARRFTDALNVIREKIPLPSVCGYVCFHPCEKKCRRRQMDDPIAVRALKRFLADRGMRGGVPWPPRAAATGKRVAVVGAGPAGLTAAYYLGRLGHEVTVFERAGDAGGTLRSGIPEFRLPRHVIASEIEAMREAAGFTLRTHAAVGSVEDLRRQGYDAVVLAFGAQKGATMGIEGEDAPGVHDCLSFLRRVNAGEPIEVGGRVVVVGGGSSAMDAARTAVRLGARQVTVMYRRTRAEMPAADEEVRDAVAEGVELSFLVVPVRIRREPGGLVVECVRMRLGTVAEDGRRRPTPVEGSTFEAPADTVVMAVGQSPEDALRGEVPTDAQRRVVVDGDTLQTSRPGVFAAGDVVTGPSSVIESIAGGRRAAEAVDRYLGGRGEIREVLAPTGEAERVPPAEEHGERRRREVPRRSAAERIADTEDVELTYPEAEAVAEAERCLACDLEQAAEDAVRQAAEADGSVAEPEVLTGAGLSPEASRVP